MKIILATLTTSLLFVGTVDAKLVYGPQLVKECYIAKYVGEVPEQTWDERGRTGEFVQLYNNGVTVKTTFSGGTPNGRKTTTFPHSPIVQKIEIFDMGKPVSVTYNYPSGIALSEELFISPSETKFSSWYADGSPQFTETRNGHLVITGVYYNRANEVEASIQNGQGDRIHRDPDGILIAKDSMVNGIVVSTTTYLANGEPCKFTPYLNGQIHGTACQYTEGGQPQVIEEFCKGQKHGKSQYFCNGEKVKEVPYYAGEKHGVEYHYNNQRVVEEITWKHGKRHGMSNLYIGRDCQTQWYHQNKKVNKFTYDFFNYNIDHRT